MDSIETSPRGDPLLTSARWLLWFLIGILSFGVVMMGIGIAAILTVQRPEVMAKIAAVGAPPSAYGIVILGFILIAALMAMTARLLMELRNIVESVRDDDPFRPENADRLQRMGWLALGGKIIWVAVVAIAHWAARFIEPERGLPQMNLLSGVLLILILFILARVFRVGAAMRDDLEGTV